MNLLKQASVYAENYLEDLKDRRVMPAPETLELLKKLDLPLSEDSSDPAEVLNLLHTFASPATVGNAGGRYFGLVTGGVYPVSLAANWLAAAWDQNAFSRLSSTAAAVIEEIALKYLIDVLALPPECCGGFVTGATMANFTCLAAARQSVLKKAGWDVNAQGLFNAPLISIVVGAEVHPTLLKALGMLGLGRERVIMIPVDDQGRMRADALSKEMSSISGPVIVCLQAGNVNTGAFDPAEEICRIARAGDAWVHVDGAFGLWAAAAPKRAFLAEGLTHADSWATDAHKWLNVPYDSGLAFVRHPDALREAMTLSAAYLPQGEEREPFEFTPESSRRARGVEIWAVLRFLGRSGLADMIERTCCHASRFAEGLKEAGHRILNEVVLNQVIVSFGDEEANCRVIAGIQQEGTCWCGPTVWQNQPGMRISVSSWATTEEDVERSLAAMIRIASEQKF
ncbi:MAG: aspartate aminotransferase family protein [SAR324 cluster bacterium]|nr:aspartate aminotransferase family protein [SAR324 cluster bacterium]